MPRLTWTCRESIWSWPPTSSTSHPPHDLFDKRFDVFIWTNKKIIQTEIDKLLAIGFIREVKYPDWLANVVVVPNKDGKWRVWVDYTNLNDVCPNDNFPLARINQIVDATTRDGMLSFLDVRSEYH